jgi:hypothetical protein
MNVGRPHRDGAFQEPREIHEYDIGTSGHDLESTRERPDLRGAIAEDIR